MERLRELICYFTFNTPRRLYKTELVKMVYMFEYYHVQTYGYQYSDVEFVRWNYGPYADTISHDLDMLVAEDIINVHEYLRTDGNMAYLYQPNNNNTLGVGLMDPSKAYIANTVIEELGSKTFTNLINIVYSTPPMESIRKEEKKLGSKLLGRELDMKKSNTMKYKTSKERLLAARKRRKERESKGSDLEYMRCMLKEHEELEVLREGVSMWRE